MSDNKVYKASVYAPVNIAVIKYWGKRDTALNLPTNSSLSVTLSTDDLRAHTTATCSQSYNTDELVLNGQAESVTGARTQACIRNLRSLRQALERSSSDLPPLSKYALRIYSQNNFPTAAGLASSAAGFAALVRAIADLYQLPATPTQLSEIARQGSGSACRSLFGGYVAWEMGSKADGTDSVAVQVAPMSHWPEMRALILVASADKKHVSSSAGMQTTVQTSPLMQTRINDLIPRRMSEMKAAIAEKDFATFAKLTMVDSNNFHATCLDSQPPIFYMNDASRAAVAVVEAINAHAGTPIAAYTFDAGPNAVIYYLDHKAIDVAGVFKTILSEKRGWSNTRAGGFASAPVPVAGEFAVETLQRGIQDVILTSIGSGPSSTDDHLSS